MVDSNNPLYQELLTRLKPLGPFQEEIKKTSIHLVRKSAFLGVHPRKQGMVLTVKAAGPIENDRVMKAEQVSKSRWHIDIKIASAHDLDPELLGWVRQAYELCA